MRGTVASILQEYFSPTHRELQRSHSIHDAAFEYSFSRSERQVLELGRDAGDAAQHVDGAQERIQGDDVEDVQQHLERFLRSFVGLSENSPRNGEPTIPKVRSLILFKIPFLRGSKKYHMHLDHKRRC